jgi:predicted ATPase/DNA-binding CsgD family transcriptional regulator
MAAWTDSATHGLAGVDRAGSARPPVAGAGQVLPQPLSSFVGREHELAELETLLGQARLVTLTGTGGSGKTRLAIEAARRTAARVGIDSAFVDLAPISDAGLVLATIATALGVRHEPPQTVAEALVARLAASPLLVVLDNLEQLLPGAAHGMSELIEKCPGLRVIATSRVALHVRGEHQYAVDPLAQTDAMTLFAERARSVDSHFRVTKENGTAIAEICRRLDGLPLAIELAAAASNLLSAQALLRRLEERVKLPGSAAVDAPARQRTLRDTIGWSYGLLDPTDQRVFARLSGFVGGFSQASAQATVPDPEDPERIDAIASLERLVDHNLVRATQDAEGEPRFTLLETIREFAVDQMFPEEAERFRERRAAYFVDEIARRTGYGAAPFWPGTVADDLDNVRAVLTWAEARDNREVLLKLAVAMWTVFGVLGHGDEAGHWLHAADRAAATAEPELKAGHLFNLARQELAFGGDRRVARKLLMRALPLSEDAGDTARTIRILVILSHIASDLRDRRTAREYLGRAVARARSLEDPLARVRLAAELAQSGHSVRSVGETKALAQEALEGARALNDPIAATDALLALTYVALAESDASRGILMASEALTIQQKGALDQTDAMAALGLARARAGDFEAARAPLIDALHRARKIRAVWLCLATLEASADWLGAVGYADRACAYWAAIEAIRARTLDRTIGDEMGLFSASRARDRAGLRTGAYDAAKAAGKEMALDDAMAQAIQDLTETNLDRGATSQGVSRGRHDLTAREKEVLQLLAAGWSDGQIAEELFISKKTAAVHVANIKGKLGAGSRVEIATTALELGLVERPKNGQLAGR